MLLIGDTRNLRLKSCCSCDRYIWCQNKFMNPFSVCRVPTQKGERKPSNTQISKTVYLNLQEISCHFFSDAESDYHNRSADIDDIDARLQRIQEMMKNGI